MLREEKSKAWIKMKKLVIALLIILLIPSVNALNINFTSPTPDTNTTINVSFAMINATLNENASQCILYWDFSNWCYQETSNESTECGGLNTGTYECLGTWAQIKGCSEAYDGYWADCGSANKSCISILNVNYTIPDYITNLTKWKLKYGNNLTNKTIPEECLDGDILQLTVYSAVQDNYTDSRSTWLCWDYSGRYWRAIIGWTAWENGNGIICEEALWWNFQYPSANNYTMNIMNNDANSYTYYNVTNITAGNHHYYVWCNNSGGVENTTETRMLIYEIPIPPEVEEWMQAAALCLIGIIAMLIFVSVKLDEKHLFLKTIYFFVSFILCVIILNAISYTNDYFRIAYYILSILIFISFVYFIIYYIRESLSIKRERQRINEGLE